MNYIIVKAEHLEKIDFSKVEQSSPESLRYSLDRELFLLKYEGDQPDFIFTITNDAIGLPEHTHSEILEILKGEEWTNQDLK